MFGLAHTSWWVNKFICHILYCLNAPKLNIFHERTSSFIKDYSTNFLDLKKN
jgi:hypothetical protein